MREVSELLNAMAVAGVIERYALFGAVAQMRYTEPVATLDMDVLVSLPGGGGLALLGPIYEFCKARGFPAEGEAIRVGSWPVQFIPTFDALTAEALEQAEEAELDGVAMRVVSAPHLAAISLSVGRGKDFARMLSLLESGAASKEAIQIIAIRHGLADKWANFQRRFLDAGT